MKAGRARICGPSAAQVPVIRLPIACQGMRRGLRTSLGSIMRVQPASGDVAMQCLARHAWDQLLTPAVAAGGSSAPTEAAEELHRGPSQHRPIQHLVVASPLQAPMDLAPHQHPFQPRQLSTLAHYQQTGMLEVITGPMFAGKTTELIKRARQAKDEGLQVLCLKSNKDTRYSKCSIATHTGDQLQCHPTSDLMSIPTQLAAQYQQSHVIVLDEAQFFADLIEFVQLATDKHQKIVIVAGLDGDFKRQRFGQLLDVIPMADRVTKLHTRCYVPDCAHPAIFSKRTTNHEEQELVGGADKYVACCRRHYLNSPQPFRPVTSNTV